MVNKIFLRSKKPIHKLKIDLNKVKIERLNYKSSAFNIISKWLWHYWGKEDGFSLTDIKYRTKYCLTSKFTFVLVAIYKNKPIGTVSLWNNDLRLRQDLTPWLAVLYVKEGYRKLGVGKLLQKMAIKESQKLGYNKLYLITDYKGYYEKSGWNFLCKASLGNNKKTRIYEYKINRLKIRRR